MTWDGPQADLAEKVNFLNRKKNGICKSSSFRK